MMLGEQANALSDPAYRLLRRMWLWPDHDDEPTTWGAAVSAALEELRGQGLVSARLTGGGIFITPTALGERVAAMGRAPAGGAR